VTKSSLSGRKRNPSFWRSIGAIFGKDLASELRTRFAVNTLLLFSVTSLTIVSFSTARTPLTKEAQSALLWIVIFFSAMTGLARSFVREEESGTADALRLTAPAESVFLGKFAFNCVLLLCVEAVVVPLSLIFWAVSVDAPLFFTVVLFAGNIGLSAVATLMAAIVAQTSMQAGLFAVLSFPVLIPLLFTAVRATLLSMDAVRQVGEIAPVIRMLFVFDIVMLTLGFLLFDYIWRDRK